MVYTRHLQKSSPGQPSVPEVIDLVLKECRKDNLVYKMAALGCAADVLQATQEDRFSDMADILIPLIKKVRESDRGTEFVYFSFMTSVFYRLVQNV